MPVFLNANHYGLIIHERDSSTTLFYDSLPHMPDRLHNGTNEAARSLDLITTAICDLTHEQRRDQIRIRAVDPSLYNRQQDGYNCGIYVCLYAESYLFNTGNVFLHRLDISFERKRILWYVTRLAYTDDVEYEPRPRNGVYRRTAEIESM